MLCKPYVTFETTGWIVIASHPVVRVQHREREAIQPYRILLGDCTIIAHSGNKDEIFADWKVLMEFIVGLPKAVRNDSVLVLAYLVEFFEQRLSNTDTTSILQHVSFFEEYDDQSKELVEEKSREFSLRLSQSGANIALAPKSDNDQGFDEETEVSAQQEEQIDEIDEAVYSNSNDDRDSQQFNLHKIFNIVAQPNSLETLQEFFAIHPAEAILHMRGVHSQTLLHLATQANNIENVQYLLEKGHDINPRDKNSWTPLHSACNSGYIDICQILLKAGANVMSLTDSFAIPLHYIVRFTEEENDSWDDCKRLIRQLLEEGADINARDCHGRTPLFGVCGRGRNENCIKFLLEMSASPNIKNYYNNMTCLHLAAHDGKVSLLKILIEAGGDPTMISDEGNALDIARHNKHESAVEYLSQYFGDSGLGNHRGSNVNTNTTSRPRNTSLFSSKHSSSQPSLTKSQQPQFIAARTPSTVKASDLQPSSSVEMQPASVIAEGKRKIFGITKNSDCLTFIDAYVCEMDEIPGVLYVWQLCFAFEPTVTTKTSKKTLIKIRDVQTVQKKNLPFRHGVEIVKKKSSSHFFFNFTKPANEVFNILEHLFTTRVNYLGKSQNKANELEMRKTLGRIKAPEIYKEMQQRFEQHIKDYEPLMEYYNTTMFSTGIIQSPVGKGRIYVTWSKLLIYITQYFSQKTMIVVDLTSLKEIKHMPDQCGIQLTYTPSTSEQSDKTETRFFKMENNELCANAYYTIQQQQGIIQQLGNTVPLTIAIMGCYNMITTALLQSLQKQNISCRFILLDKDTNAENRLDSLLLPIQSSWSNDTTYELYYLSINDSLDLWHQALRDVRKLFFSPNLPCLVEQTDKLYQALHSTTNKLTVEHLVWISPVSFAPAESAVSPRHSFFSAHHTIQQKLQSCGVPYSTIILNPTCEHLSLWISAFWQLIFIPNQNHPTSFSTALPWIQTCDVLVALEKLLLSKNDRFYHQTFYLTGNEPFSLMQVPDIITKMFPNSQLTLCQNHIVAKQLWKGDYCFSPLEIQYLCEFSEIFASHITQESTDELRIVFEHPPSSISSFFQKNAHLFIQQGTHLFHSREIEHFKTIFKSMVLSHPASLALSKEAANNIANVNNTNNSLTGWYLERDGFLQNCGCFLQQTGFSQSLFNAFSSISQRKNSAESNFLESEQTNTKSSQTITFDEYLYSMSILLKADSYKRFGFASLYYANKNRANICDESLFFNRIGRVIFAISNNSARSLAFQSFLTDKWHPEIDAIYSSNILHDVNMADTSASMITQNSTASNLKSLLTLKKFKLNEMLFKRNARNSSNTSLNEDDDENSGVELVSVKSGARKEQHENCGCGCPSASLLCAQNLLSRHRKQFQTLTISADSDLAESTIITTNAQESTAVDHTTQRNSMNADSENEKEEKTIPVAKPAKTGKKKKANNRLGLPIVFGHEQWETVWHMKLAITRSVQFADEEWTKLSLADSFDREQEYRFDCNTTVDNTNVANNVSTTATTGLSTSSNGTTSAMNTSSTTNVNNCTSSCNASHHHGCWWVKDTAPFVFKRIRKHYGISSTDYLNSLGAEKFISSLLLGKWNSYRSVISSGRSGSVFFISHDGKYFLKSLPEEEEVLFRRVLKSYFFYITENPNTLLTRFYGLYRIKPPGTNSWMSFVVMENLFAPLTLPVHEIYDLKGSTVNRHVEIKESQDKSTVALKDNDFFRVIRIGSKVRVVFLEQVERDIRWMESHYICDYSLLVGLHFREHSPSSPNYASRPTVVDLSKSHSESDLDSEQCLNDLPLTAIQTCNSNSRGSLFKAFDGGILSSQKDEVYFIGIIDILTEYNYKKKGEHLAKSFWHNAKEISAVPPPLYRKRYQKYVNSIII